MFSWFRKKHILNVSRKHIDFNHNRYTNHYHNDQEINCLLRVEIVEWFDSNLKGSYKFESGKYPTWLTLGELHMQSKEFFDNVMKACEPKIIFSNKNDRLLFKLIWG